MESSKVLLFSLAVLVSCFLTASSLECYKCDGTNTKPQCNATETCSSSQIQCLSSVEKDGNTTTYKQECALPAACTAKKTVCAVRKLLKTIDDCAYECCDEDRCNDDFPSLASTLKCYECEASGQKPNCNKTQTCDSTRSQCISQVEKKDDKITYKQQCALPTGVCSLKKNGSDINFAYSCCNTSLCNKDFPFLSSGIQVTSGLVAIAATLVFAFFVM